MTINQLIKKLEKIQKTHGKRIKVVVDIEGVENTNDDYSHVNIETVDVETITWSVDDNAFLQNGEERLKTVVTLCGR